MAFPTAVNTQITDAITQTNVKVLGEAPAMSMGNLFEATSQALSNAAHNASYSQQNNLVIATGADGQPLYSLDTALQGVATAAILGK